MLKIIVSLCLLYTSALSVGEGLQSSDLSAEEAYFKDKIEIIDSVGKHYFSETPQRIVVLNWALTEQLLALGVKPIAIADVEGYQKWFNNQPALPEGMMDVGDRLAPDLSAIIKLKPDLILVGQSQRDLIRRLQDIAPVLYFKNFSARYALAEKASERLLTLAKLMRKESVAQHLLAQREQRLAQLKEALKQEYANDLPQVVLVRAEGERCCWLIAENAIASYSLRALGLSSAVNYPATKFGLEFMRADDLPELNNVTVLLIRSAGSLPNLDNNQDWLKFIAGNQIIEIDHVTSFGGVLSVGYMAESITAGLLKSK